MKPRTIETKRGARVRVLEGGTGKPLVFLHGAGGLFAENPFLDRLAERYRVFAPELPGYGESTGETLLEDMLDFTLHGWDVVAALGVERPLLVGHSMGGMIAAEMAALCPRDVAKLVLVASTGLWIPEQPIADLYAMLPFEYPRLLFHDPDAGAALLTAGADFSNLEALAAFYIENSRRMAMAGKILFPIPNRRLAKRLYRVTAETLVVWGKSDRLVPPVYGERFRDAIAGARLVVIDEAGHMVPYEQPDVFVSVVSGFAG
ncbi:MAG TPA: alpha/beta fold hydrolase [Candidatus Binatia bacterium]|nr:alpha/beta fold hydrolase [Candidatus Binatia bacterium]